MNTIVGIDPGLTGAVAVITDNGEVIFSDMPVTPKTTGKGNKVSAVLLRNNLQEMLDKFPVHTVYIEDVHAMPQQGVTSVFSFGRSLGVIEGVVGALSYRMSWVAPNKWKKKAGLTGKEKDAARTMAIDLYPKAAEFLKRKKDIGRADALLIAHFGRLLDE